MGEKSRKLYEEIADKLMSQIQSGELQPGDRLPSERSLSKAYGVSRSVIREAIRSMERMGCIESHVGGGNYVKTPEISDIVDPLSIIFSQDPQFAAELTEARLILETEIVSLAAERRTEAQIKAMYLTLQEMQRDILNGGKGIAQDIKFHTQLVEAAGNRAMTLVVATCTEVLNRSMEVTQHIEGVPQKAVIDHENILKAVVEQNGTEAKKYMQRHLLSAHENLKKVQNF